ncbi:hypothetical protein [Mesorhizobium sp. M0478]|uniref:hypothetical protein n=1 Tax=Mesorhizobium sp. M0478 TaxID=2956947 RepID=UPI00333B742F
MSGIAHFQGPVNSASTPRSILPCVVAGLCAFAIVIYQSWFMPYFLPFFTGRDEFARLVFHALYGSVLIVSIAVLAIRRDVRGAILLLAIAGAMAVAPVALHPLGIVAKCYLITLFLGGGAIVLMLASSPAMVLRLCASVTALNAVVCFLDLLFANGFTSTLGRAAGLAINPNVAAAGLLLGAAASYRAVAPKWRATFLVLVSAALLVTLSRSNILAACGTVAVPFAVDIWQQFRGHRRLRLDPRGWGRPLAVALILLGTIGVALATNVYFRVSVGNSFAGMISVGKALDEAADAVDSSHNEVASSALDPVAPSSQQALAESSSAATIDQPTAEPSIRSDPPQADPARATASSAPPFSGLPSSATGQSTNAAKIQALGERLVDEGKRNSISARALFLERGLLAYREGGFFGQGLEVAQALAPHNTLVLFAIAFGHIGWLIPIGLVASAFWYVRSAGDLALGVALVGVMLTSHDLLLTPSLFLPVALGIGGMLAERRGFTETHSSAKKGEHRSFAFGANAGVMAFAAGCIAILLITPSLVTGRLQNETMFTARGGYETLLPRSQFPGLFQFDNLVLDPLLKASDLREEGTPLHQVEWAPNAWPAVGPGEYTYRRRDAVLFSATDSSDPRQNGRTYAVAVPLSVSALCLALLGTIIAWSIVSTSALTPRISRREASL